MTVFGWVVGGRWGGSGGRGGVLNTHSRLPDSSTAFFGPIHRPGPARPGLTARFFLFFGGGMQRLLIDPFLCKWSVFDAARGAAGAESRARERRSGFPAGDAVKLAVCLSSARWASLMPHEGEERRLPRRAARIDTALAGPVMKTHKLFNFKNAV